MTDGRKDKWTNTLEAICLSNFFKVVGIKSWKDNTPPLLYCRQIILSKMDKLCQLAIPKQTSTISMQIASLLKIHRYSHKLLSRNKNIDRLWTDNSVKNWWNMPINNPKLDPQYQCTYQIWWKSTEIYSNYRPETINSDRCGQITLSKIDEIYPLAIPNNALNKWAQNAICCICDWHFKDWSTNYMYIKYAKSNIYMNF